MSARKIGASWWVDFRFKRGRHRKRSPDNSKAGAQAFEAMLRREVAKHGSIEHVFSKSKDSQNLATFVAKWLKLYVDVNNKYSEQCTKRRVLEKNLLPIFGKMPIDKISSLDIEEFKRQQLAEGLSPKTINNSLTILRKCLATAVDWGELALVPKVKLLKTTPPKFKYLLPEEVERLLAVKCEEPWACMMRVAVRTGLRYSELVGLEWEDVDSSKKSLCVRRACVMGKTGTPKNGRIRYMPLTQDAMDALRALPKTSKQVFHLSGKQINYSMGRWAIRKTCEAAGIRVVCWHALRHTFASHLVSKGASLKAVQELLGHSTINMTLRYSHLSQDNLREAIALLEPKKEEIWATGGQDEKIEASKPFDLATLLRFDSTL